MGGGDIGDLWKLHMRKRGIKRVRAKESISNFLSDRMTIQGCVQNVRPMKSPTLRTTKWKEMNSSGWTLGLVEMILMVIVGNTDYMMAISICIRM